MINCCRANIEYVFIIVARCIVIRYIYSGQITLNTDTVLGLLVLADKYNVPDLKVGLICVIMLFIRIDYQCHT